MPKNTEQLEQENAELKAQLSSLVSRSPNPAPDFISGSADDEIDLRELWSAIWQGKWLIVVITAFFAVGAVLYALSIPDEYKSTAILAPTSTSNSSSLTQLAGQFGGLASLAGVNLGGGGGDKITIALEVINTWGFLESFIENNHLEVEVFAVNGWDKANNKLLLDTKLYDEGSANWALSPESKVAVVPSSWQLYEQIKNRVTVSQNLKTGLVSLTVEHFSPYAAKRWVELLILAINKHLQMQDRIEALNSIEYLKEQIKKTSIAEMRTIFYQLIEEQTKTLMLAEISNEYVFKTISPAKVAEKKSKPARALVSILGFMLGGIIGIIAVIVRHFSNKKA